MSPCQGCGKEVKYGEGWGGCHVCASCRAKRANKSRQERAKLSGKSAGTRSKEEW